MRRAGSRPLLRSAIVGLGAGGGMMVTGCLLCAGAPAASAQTLAAVVPASSAHGGGPNADSQGSAHAGGHAATQSGTQAGTPGPADPHGRTPPGLSDLAARGQSQPAPFKHGQGAHSPHSAATLHLIPQATTTTTAVNTASRQAHFAKALPPSAPQDSASPPPDGSGNGNGNGNEHNGNGNGNGKGTTGHGKRTINSSGNSTTNSKSTRNRRTTSNGKSTGNGAAPAPASGTPVAEAVAAPLPTQRPVRPERFFTIPLAPLSPIPAAGGPLSGTALPLAPARRAGRELFRFGASVLPRDWVGESLKESGKLKLPIALMVATAMFMLVQALVDRRDPKVSDAPERQTDDSVGFG